MHRSADKVLHVLHFITAIINSIAMRSSADYGSHGGPLRRLESSPSSMTSWYRESDTNDESSNNLTHFTITQLSVFSLDLCMSYSNNITLDRSYAAGDLSNVTTLYVGRTRQGSSVHY